MSRRLAALLAAATLVPLAGCGDSGSGSSGTGADPAKVVPADAAAYAEAAIRPQGDVKDNANDALKKLLKTDDPGAKITGLIDKALAKKGSSWDQVKEWLGERAGVFISGVQGGMPIAAVVLDITDKDKASAALAKKATGKSTYKGVEIKTSNGASLAFLDDYAIIGTAPGVKQVIDTSQGRQPLSDAADYSAMRKTLKADDALGIAFAQPQRILDLLQQVLPAVQSSGAPGASALASPQFAQILRQAIGQLGRAAGIALHADGNAIRLDGAGIGNTTPDNPAAADEVAALPDDAWLALGFKDLGGSLTKALAQFSQLSRLGGAMVAPATDIDAALKAFTSKFGIDIKRDLLSWMGQGAIYARGSSLVDIGAVLTVKSKDPAKSLRAVKLLGRALARSGRQVAPATVPGYDSAIKVQLSDSTPIALYIASNGERFSLGVNPQALSDVLSPAKKFGDSDTYKRASDALGGDLRPVFVLDFPSVVNLLQTLGVSNNPSFARVKQYLDVIGTIAVGTVHDGDTSRFGLAVGLR